jgi:RNA polymerase sigma factor (sigma-70 family)
MEFAEFYESARDDCLQIVLLNVGDRQLAEDLVAEGFAKAWVSWRKLRNYQAPRAWVVRAALNANVSRWRRHRREVGLDGHDVSVPAADSAMLSGELLAALRGLPLRQREVVTLRLLLDLDTETTARLLGIAPGTVGVHLHRAAETLRSALPHLADQEARK